MKRTKEQINKRKINRAERLDYLEHIDNLIKFLKMNDQKLNQLKEIRGNSERYTLEQLKNKVNNILYSNN